MKKKNYRFIGLAMIAALLIALPSVASADLTVYFEKPQSITIPYDISADNASGTNIVLQSFDVGTTHVTGATVSFSFIGGVGSFSVSQGANILFLGDLSSAQINPVTGINPVTHETFLYYQILGFITPSAGGSALYGFDYGQLNITFNTNGSYRAGYIEIDGNGSKTPIPAAFLLFGSGLFGLVCIRRRKK
jgi:hypothetical protein